jgi:DNA-binding NarL/FixJ family response regulator
MLYREPPTAATFIPSLSPKEYEVFRACAMGKTNQEAAIALGTTEQTVKNYLRNIFEKLGVWNRTELALKWPELIKAA